MSYNQLSLRQNATAYVHNRIANGRCWHFDAWLLLDEADMGALYLIVQTRKGGRDVLQQHTYKVHWQDDGSAGLRMVGAAPGHANAVYLNVWPLLYARLNDLHWRLVYPMTLRRPDEFTFSSVRLHYIPAPSLDPMAGAQNFSPYARTA